MGTKPKFGSPIDRRAMLRGTAGAGLALPFGIPALAKAQEHQQHGEAGATPTDGYVGSDPSSGGTGTIAPVATEILPFERYDPMLPAVEPGPKTINMFAGDRTLYIAQCHFCFTAIVIRIIHSRVYFQGKVEIANCSVKIFET